MLLEYNLNNYSLLLQGLFAVQLSYRFYVKYKVSNSKISLNWMYTFILFALASLSAIIYSINPLDLDQINNIHYDAQYVMMGFSTAAVGFIVLAFFASNILPKTEYFNYATYALIVISFVSSFIPSLEFLSIIILQVFSIIVMFGYSYLAYRGKNRQLYIVTVYIITTGIGGYLVAAQYIDTLAFSLIRAFAMLFLLITVLILK